MDSILRPVLRPVLQPVLRSVFGASGGGGTPSLTAQVQALFAKYSAAGGMWDFTDMATLFQDSARTVPVTSASQPVGGVNDISGLHRVLAQPTSGKRPLFNGAGVTPDGVDDAFTVTIDLSACDKSVVAMGYENVTTVEKTQIESSSHWETKTGSMVLFSGQSSPSNVRRSGARGTGTTTSASLGRLPTAPGAGYGAHIGRHSIPGSLSEVWWNAVKGTDGTADKGSGTFMASAFGIFARAGVDNYSSTPARRALILGVPVASPQVSDDDVELIRLWLMEGAV